MQINTRIVASLVLAGSLLAGCGSDERAGQSITVLRDVVGSVLSSTRTPQASPGVTEADIATTLQRTKDPLVLVTVEDRKSSALAIQIETNGPYRTFATQARQTFITRGGMITGTRGLGGDLMSSESTSLLRLVSARRSGTVPYAMRFLTPDNQTKTETYNCTVAPGAIAPFGLGSVSTQGRIVTAKCSGDEGNFTNGFIVAPDGYIVAARQFLGEVTGILAVQAARR